MVRSIDQSIDRLVERWGLRRERPLEARAPTRGVLANEGGRAISSICRPPSRGGVTGGIQSKARSALSALDFLSWVRARDRVSAGCPGRPRPHPPIPPRLGDRALKRTAQGGRRLLPNQGQDESVPTLPGEMSNTHTRTFQAQHTLVPAASHHYRGACLHPYLTHRRPRPTHPRSHTGPTRSRASSERRRQGTAAV